MQRGEAGNVAVVLDNEAWHLQLTPVTGIVGCYGA